MKIKFHLEGLRCEAVLINGSARQSKQINHSLRLNRRRAFRRNTSRREIIFRLAFRFVNLECSFSGPDHPS